MAPEIGYSRQIPLAGEGGAGSQGGTRVGGARPQEAVRILSLRVPEHAPNAPPPNAPSPLVKFGGQSAAQTQASLLNDFGIPLDNMIRALVRAFPGPGGAAAPVPGVVSAPGLQVPAPATAGNQFLFPSQPQRQQITLTGEPTRPSAPPTSPYRPPDVRYTSEPPAPSPTPPPLPEVPLPSVPDPAPTQGLFDDIGLPPQVPNYKRALLREGF